MSCAITTYQCSECPQPKGAASNWFSVRINPFGPQFMNFEHAHYRYLDDELVDFCGNNCAQKYLERWLSKPEGETR